MLDLFWIAVIVVIIIDVSGFTDHLKSWLKSVLTGGRMRDPNYSLKPLDCSFCMTWWVGLIYIVCVHSFCLWMLAYLLGLCVLTPVMKDLIILVRESMLKIIRYLL